MIFLTLKIIACCLNYDQEVLNCEKKDIIANGRQRRRQSENGLVIHVVLIKVVVLVRFQAETVQLSIRPFSAPDVSVWVLQVMENHQIQVFMIDISTGSSTPCRSTMNLTSLPTRPCLYSFSSIARKHSVWKTSNLYWPVSVLSYS